MWLRRSVGLIVVLVLAWQSAYIHGKLIEPSLFENVLTDIANNALGVDKVQAYYSSLSYTNVPVDGSSLVEEISSSLSNKFDGPIQALEKLKFGVEQEIASFTNRSVLQECCQVTGAVYNERFMSTVNINEACIVVSENSPSEIRFPTRKISDLMKENYRDNPQLKWQYLGTEDGVLLNYPSFKFSTCTRYDPRFRPFYVSSATQTEKDVVIVIDKSTSMSSTYQGQTLIQIAKDATITVLQTLNPNDRFSVVAFSSSSEVLGAGIRDCISSYQLSQATPPNIKFFEERINELFLTGMTNYEAALDTAFRFFESSTGGERARVILFLTDGDNTAGGDPLSLIAERNGNLSNEVIIMTYGLGSSLPKSAQDMLFDMANQTYSYPSLGEIQRGIFEHIVDPSKLRSAMASYYNRFSQAEDQLEATFTVPYYDLFGLGLLMSLCLPVYQSDNSLFGVVCSDLTVSNLVSDISYFKQGEDSYSFIVDGKGRTLIHPLLPLPSEANDDPVYVDIQHLERQSAATEVTQSMKRGESGNRTFSSTRTLSRGDVYYEGINTKTVMSAYFWTPVPRSNFSLCIVVGSGDVQSNINALKPGKETFFYHRMDISENLFTSCKHYNRFATIDKSTVMITPRGFENPSLYLETIETSVQTKKYASFLTGVTTSNPGFKHSIINSVTATYKAEETWRASPEAGKMVIWRYMGTTDGVVRVYPGVQLPKHYDHSRRPWYQRSIANKGKLMLSTPYEDLWGAGFLITMSTAVTEPGPSGRTLAIIATDLTMTYLYNALTSIPEYSKCENDKYDCFLIDDSGFIILHRDFVNTTSKRPKLENVHITYKKPAIADDLLNLNVMKKVNCIDFEDMKEHYTYRITTTSDGLDRLSSPTKFVIQPVQDTNIFIVIHEEPEHPLQTTCCEDYGTKPDVLQCKTPLCDCLCYRATYLTYSNECSNEYEQLIDAGPTCSPRTPAMQAKSVSEIEKIKNISRCFETHCERQMRQSDCHGISGCSWCSKDQNLNALLSPYCTRQENCYFGIESLSQCQAGICEATTKSPSEEFDNKSSVIGIAVGSSVAFGFVIATGVFIYTKRHTSHRRSRRHSEFEENMAANSTFGKDNPVFHTEQSVRYNNQIR